MIDLLGTPQITHKLFISISPISLGLIKEELQIFNETYVCLSNSFFFDKNHSIVPL
jgi:hypothetical protein